MQKTNVLDFWGIDIEKIKATIENSAKLEDDKQFFTDLTAITQFKTIIKDSLEELESFESEVKGLINTKAKALYGESWQVIAGEHFKITRSKSGELYLINGKPNTKFTKVKISVDSKEVDNFVAEHGKLPAGIEINDKRGESLRITVK
jgi:hypothetical protein